MHSICEKFYNRTGALIQVRTESGRLVRASRHIEHVEHLTHGRGHRRIIWKRVNNFGRVVWLAK
jgi:hypothetical protein